jgi:TPP-dependent indolepyruvate ferredoxin oxidoreductase alpha subunit
MNRYLDLVERLKESVLASRGATDPGLRRAVEARAAELAGRPGAPTGDIPPGLREHVDKIALHAYTVTDEDVAALKAAGWSEDAIFEISIAAALGAGLSRLERGLSALRGEP